MTLCSYGLESSVPIIIIYKGTHLDVRVPVLIEATLGLSGTFFCLQPPTSFCFFAIFPAQHDCNNQGHEQQNATATVSDAITWGLLVTYKKTPSNTTQS